MKRKGITDGNITTYCPYKSGKFDNGRIYSFCDLDSCTGEEEYKANKDCTNYGPYYDGENWDHNFVELFTDRHLKIYSVIDNKGNKLRIGDQAPNIMGEGNVLITSFYVNDRNIYYKGIETKFSLGRLGIEKRKIK